MLMFVARLIAPPIFAGALFAACLPAQAKQPPTDFAIENQDAKTAFERGMTAVKLLAWDEAADGFLEAWEKEEKQNPVIYFNFGLALGRANQPLLAAMCLQAYLALSPKAENANRVRDEIARLEKAGFEKLAIILKSMESRAAAIEKDSELHADRTVTKIKAYENIEYIYATIGKMDDAVAAASLIREWDSSLRDDRPSLWVSYARELVRAGDVKKAQDILAMVEKTFPVPPDYETDAKLKPADKAYYKSRKDEIANLRKNYFFDSPGQEIAWKTDAWHILESVIGRYAEYKADRRKDASSIIKTMGDTKRHRFAEFDLEGTARIISETLKQPRPAPPSMPAWYRDPDIYAISLMGNTAYQYGGLGLKYQYIKDEISRGALPPKSGADEPTRKERLLRGMGWIGVELHGTRAPGAYVGSVNDVGPAKRAGILTGDIIVKLAGKEIADMHDLIRAVRDTPVGKDVEIVIVRDGKEETKMVKIERRQD